MGKITYNEVPNFNEYIKWFGNMSLAFENMGL